MGWNRRRGRWIAATIVTVLVTGALLNAVRAPFAAAGVPLYPDLRTAPPGELWIDHLKLSDGKFHYLLRFDNQVENYGGRFEIAADLSVSRDIYQNVYDAEVDGNLVEHRRMTSDLVYHPTHNHFHLSDFANYSLYKKSASGVYRVTTKRGSKTSFCILDSVKVVASASSRPAYTECNAKQQGLSAGWADIYTSGLPDQWVDLGTRMLTDGDYALHSTADPYNRVVETDNSNNTGVTLFSIKNGELVDPAGPIPYCAAKPASAPVGGAVYVSCERLPAATEFAIRWRYESSDPIVTAVTNDDGEFSTQFVMPPSTRGAHYIYVSGGNPAVSLRIIVDTAPTVTVLSPSGNVGQVIGYALSGFSAGTRVDLTYEQLPDHWVSIGSVTTNGKGEGSASFVIPSSAAGSHNIRASEGSSSAPAIASITVIPQLRLQPASIDAGGPVRPWLRGFGSRDSVVLSIQETGAVLKTVNVSSTGAVNPNLNNEFVIPADLTPGEYHILAIGSKSGATATAALTVTAVIVAAAPSPTSTPTPTATATSTPQPTPTETTVIEPTVVPTVAAETPAATAEPATPAASEPAG